MNKKIISIIASFSIIMCMVSPSNGYAKERESDVVVFHDIAYMTITDHYSKAEHSGSYDVSWSENGRYETYTIDVQCINNDDKAPEIYVEISLSDRNASDALRHLLGNIKYCSEDVTLVEYDTEDTLHCIADGLSTNGRANSFLTVMNDYKYEYGIKPDATTFAVFSVNNPNLTPMVSIDVLGTEFNVNTVLSDSSSQYTIIQQGVCEGTIIGGNLCTLNLLQGTQFMPHADDIVLFVEDDNIMGDYFIYEFDRNFQSLLHAYGTERTKGVVFGRFDDSCHMSADVVKRIIADKMPKDIPVMFGVDFGHVFPMITFPIDGRVRVEATVDPQIEIGSVPNSV